MKNLFLIFITLSIVGCSSSSSFNKRKYTKGRIGFAKTTGNYTEPKINATESETNSPVISKKKSHQTKEKNIRKIGVVKQSTSISKELIINEKLDSPALTKAEKKQIRKQKRQEKKEIERKKIAKMSKAILMVMLSSTISMAGISFISRGLFYIFIWGVFPASFFSFFFFGVVILLLIYLF